MSDERTPHLEMALAFAGAPSNPTHKPADGETDDTLDLIAQCADNAARTGDIARLTHVAASDVPRLLAEIMRLRGRKGPSGPFFVVLAWY